MAAVPDEISEQAITEVYLSPLNKQLAYVVDGGGGGVFVLDADGVAPDEVAGLTGDWRRVWP